MFRADDSALYRKKLTPMLRGLQRSAHAMTGNRAIGEYALNTAILETYLRRADWHGRPGFRESIMRSLRAVVLAERGKVRRAEMDWPGLAPAGDGEDPILLALEEASLEAQRALILRFGCGMTPREVARITGMRQDVVRDAAAAFRLRAQRLLRRAGKPSRAPERAIAYSIRRALNREGDDVPSAAQALRSFEQDAETMRPPRHIARKLLKAVFFSLGALLCAALFLVGAVLMHY